MTSEPPDTEPEKSPFEPRDGVPSVIDTPEALQAYCADLAHGSGPVALDAERASGYRYDQRAYLVQVRREGAGTALIDPVPFPDLRPLQEAIGDAEWILHAATQDLPCLAELGLRPASLFDTELAGRLLGRDRVSLAALTASALGEVLEKGHGATDWSVRPLSDAQLRYAALDVELLIELRDAMEGALDAAGKAGITAEEFEALLDFQPRERGDDEWRRTSGIHKVRKPRQLAAVRELWTARDTLARDRDIAVGRLLPDSSIIVAAQSDVTSKAALRDLSGFHGRGAHRYLTQWWEALHRARELPEAECPGPPPRPDGPPQPRLWADRDPAAFARLTAARAALADVAEEHQLPVENLMAPDTVRRLCWSPPEPATEAAVVAFLEDQGARRWQIGACLPGLMSALAAEEHSQVTDQ